MRSSITASRLVRLLGPAVPADAGTPGMDVAERLALWFNVFDAMGLQAAHRAAGTIAEGGPAARKGRPPDLREDLARARGALARAIELDPLALYAADGDGLDAAYGCWLRRYQELQRQMEQMTQALRDHVRQALSRATPALRQLAVLDAAYEPVLVRHEQRLLARVPALLKQRFDESWPADGGASFAEHWRSVLLAELDLRLEPVMGLIEAHGQESN